MFDEHEMELPKEGSQPTNDPTELWKLSEVAHGQLKSWLDDGNGICDRIGFKTVDNPDAIPLDGRGGFLALPSSLKAMARSKEKVAKEYKGDWSQLLDVARCSIVVDDYGDVRPVLAKLRAGGMKLSRRPKDRFNDPIEVGYRDVMMNCTMPNGAVVEVQLHLKKMMQAKKVGHPLYNITRELDPKVKAKTVTPDEKKRYDEAFQEQKNIYGSAWNELTGDATRTGDESSPTDMRKALGMPKYSFIEHDNAMYRRNDENGGIGVDDVLNRKSRKWEPFEGDAFEPGYWGSKVEDPLGGNGGDEDGDVADQDGREPAMAKSLLARVGDGLRVIFKAKRTA